MKITKAKVILYKLRWENINCNNIHMICKKQKTTSVYFILFLCMFLTTGVLFAQPDSKKTEAENLNVFHQWIKWNNPGSFLLNHLTNQAEEYYRMRDNEIAKLKTKSDWIKRQQVVKSKLKDLIGAFPRKEALNPEITGVIQKEGYRIETN